jgi:hypothetical protein
MTQEETKNPLKTAHASKVVNPFTHALVPPFLGRRRDFYIPKILSNLGNIPSVNMYMNVFYIPWFAGLISYIYKPAISSQAKLELFRWHLWLGFLLIPESSIRDPRISEIWARRFAGPWFQGFAGPRSPDSRDFLIPYFRDFLASNSRKIARSETDRKFEYKSLVQLLIPCQLKNLQNTWNSFGLFTSSLLH